MTACAAVITCSIRFQGSRTLGTVRSPDPGAGISHPPQEPEHDKNNQNGSDNTTADVHVILLVRSKEVH